MQEVCEAFTACIKGLDQCFNKCLNVLDHTFSKILEASMLGLRVFVDHTKASRNLPVMSSMYYSLLSVDTTGR